jgi:hypothetical protein
MSAAAIGWFHARRCCKTCKHRVRRRWTRSMIHSSLRLAMVAASCTEGVQRTSVNLHHLHRGDPEVLFSLSDVLECSGLDDAVWALRAVPTNESSEAEWVGRTFAADCVERALEGLPASGPVRGLVVDAVRVGRRLAERRVGSAELAAVWRSLRLPTRVGMVGLLLRAAKASIFPGGVSEAARHSAVCAARATVEGEPAARRWQVARLRWLLLADTSPNQALQRTGHANDGYPSSAALPA